MPRVTMIKLLAGPDGSMHPGKTYDVSDALARALDAASAAIVLDPLDPPAETQVERAVVVPPERAVAPPQKSRKPKS